MNLVDRIIRDEGFEGHAYRCPAGKLTIGYGRNIDPDGGKGITEREALHLLHGDLIECENDLADIFGWDFWLHLDTVRRYALINMRYNLGPAGFRGFVNMIEAIKRKEWGLAAREAMDSRWAVQVGKRARRIADELRDGVAMS